MREFANEIIKELKDLFEKNIQHTIVEFSRLRAGKASPAMLEGVMVEYYGNMVPLSQVANISSPDARSLAIQPWEKTMIRPIETAIINGNLGFAPQNDGEVIRINIPPLTEERRTQLVKSAKNENENSKVGLRNSRKEALESIRKLKADGLSEDDFKAAEAEIQKLIDSYSKRIDDLTVVKEKEIMTI